MQKNLPIRKTFLILKINFYTKIEYQGTKIYSCNLTFVNICSKYEIDSCFKYLAVQKCVLSKKIFRNTVRNFFTYINYTNSQLCGRGRGFHISMKGFFSFALFTKYVTLHVRALDPQTQFSDPQYPGERHI